MLEPLSAYVVLAAGAVPMIRLDISEETVACNSAAKDSVPHYFAVAKSCLLQNGSETIQFLNQLETDVNKFMMWTSQVFLFQALDSLEEADFDCLHENISNKFINLS